MVKQKLIYYYILLLSLIAVLIVIDQVSKNFFILLYAINPPHNSASEVLPILDFVYAWNHGISFGLLSEYQYSNIAFLIVNSAIIIYLGYLLIRSQTCLPQIGLSFIIGGAVGNLIDRLYHGAVFDFIYFHYQDWGFPAFNLADSFITIGAIFFIYDYMFRKK